MRAVFLSSLSLFFFYTLLYQRVESQDIRADTPPRGWNSYDSYSWIITEEDFLENAKIQAATLKTHGYEYVVVGYLWYRNSSGDRNSKGLDMIDEWGRVMPDPDRWPSSKGGKGFKEVADEVHAMGLKFGIHVMRGISTQAVNANTPILDITTGKAYEEKGREWRARDIGLTGETCAWMNNGFMKVDDYWGASKVFLRSLYQQYADWGVDFVKNDCVFGEDLDLWQIKTVSEILSELERPILYSLSPGVRVTLDNGVAVSKMVNMYRITGSDWDKWGDVEAHFDVARNFASNQMIGASGLKGKSWPDLDMLPFGWLTRASSKEGPHRSSRLGLDEQRTQMTLWCMAKSPIMFGGDLKNLDTTTLRIITNPDLLEINSYTQFNAEFPFISGTPAVQSDRSNKKRFLTRKTSTNKEVKETGTHVMGLTSCKNQEAKGWVIQALDKEAEQICWKYPLGSRYKPQFCLNKRKPVMTVIEEAVYEKKYIGKYHLFAADKQDLCLDGASTTKHTSNEIHSSSFSPCKWHTNQMWELSLNGTLVNSYSGQCATMKPVKAANDDVVEYRAWTAVGRRAECYVAFFNLSPQRMEISAKLSDLAKGLPVTNNCTYREIWTETSVAEVKESISMSIASHGCALFVLECTGSLVESQVIRADTPPRGWNSYDSYSWIINEEDFLENAKVQSAVLKNHGYEYVVVDYLWYRNSSGDANSIGLDLIDEWGRVIPDPDRWPSSKGGKGFKEVADKVHAMGLKFGIHVMRGISTQAVTANTPILDITTGRAYGKGEHKRRASDIGLTEETCAWMNNGFMKVDNNLGASIAFLKSLYQQYADWGVDLVKNDCVFGEDMDLWQIQTVSEFLSELERPILYSLSPGARATPKDGALVSKMVNMYRITGDDWDKWEDVKAHFDVARDFASSNMIGASGLKGKSWPDLDMLPLGWLTDAAAKEGPHRSSRLSLDEQKTQMTLWCMAKSPIMFGGDLKNLDNTTLNIITNPELLEINSYTQFNAEFPFISGTPAIQSDRSNNKRFLTRKTSTIKEVKKTGTHVMGLTSCKNEEANGWVNEALDKETERVCWKYPLGSRYKPRFCLNKRKPVMTFNEEAVYEQRYKGKYHLFAADKQDLCLDGASTRRLTSNEIHSSSFSPCKWHTNQMWELGLNGTLVNSYSGQCATMKAVKAANDDVIEYRAWTAIGRRAECYVAFFNLSPQRLEISAKLSDLAKGLPVTDHCTYKEIWSKTSYGEVKESISISIASHGCALFVLECTGSL